MTERAPTEEDLLCPMERASLRGDYRRYFLVKRQNYFATIQAFPELWDCFLRLDEIWIREFNDLEQLSSTTQIVPMQLFLKSHAQFRIAFELGFSSAIGEAWNLARGSIDTAVRAFKIHREPKLALVWSAKDDGKKQADEYRQAFEANKKESLFSVSHGLRELHEFYIVFSEGAAHSTLRAMAIHHKEETNAHGINWIHNYLTDDQRKIALSVNYMLNAFALIEKAFFNSFNTRLELDPVLARMREEFIRNHVLCAQHMVARFKIAPPFAATSP